MSLPTPPKAEKQSTTDAVYDAVKELDRLGQSANRHSIQTMTGLKMTIVDDRLKILASDGELFRTGKGNYEVVKTYPAPRAMSKSVVEGWCIYEVGDNVLRLTPAENRQMAELFAGPAVQVAVLESVRQHQNLAIGLAEKVEYLMRQMKALNAQPDVRQMVIDV